MKKLYILIGVLCVIFCGCAKVEEEKVEDVKPETQPQIVDEVEETEDEFEIYESKDGWKVEYYPELVTCNESENSTSFVYTGDCAGSTLFEFTYVPDRMPHEEVQEHLKDCTEEYQIVESNFGSVEGVWSTNIIFTPKSAGSGFNESFCFVEHNGGTIVIDEIWHSDEDELRAIKVSDTMATVLDTFEFTKHDPQVEYSYMVGKYELQGEGSDKIPTSLELKDDHTGIAVFDEEKDIFWTSKRIGTYDSSDEYSFEIEGNELKLSINDEEYTYCAK